MPRDTYRDSQDPRRRWLLPMLAVVVLAANLFQPARMSEMGLWLLSVLEAPRFLAGLAVGEPGGVGSAPADAGEAALRSENRELRAALAAYQAQNLEMARELDLLQELRGLPGGGDVRVVSTRVSWGRGASDWRSVVFLDRGRKDGIRPGQPIVVGRSLVGRIEVATPYASRGLLIQDPDFQVSVAVLPGAGTERRKPTEKPREGILQGAAGRFCLVRWIDRGAGVRVGDPVVVSFAAGGAWVGLYLGHVTSVDASSDAFYPTLQVDPSVRLQTGDRVQVLVDREDAK